MFLWSIMVTELSLVSSCVYDDDFSLCVILKALVNTVYFIIESSTMEHPY